ncbi:MAG: DUF4131 domain-containing protein [Evtepia gabavorous]
MILLWFTAGVVPAVLLGVYLPWSAWVLPVGLGSLAAGFLFKGLEKWPPLRRFLFGAGAILVWLAVYSALFHAPAQDLEHRTIQMEAVVTQWPEETDYGFGCRSGRGEGKAGRCPRCFMDRRTWRTLRPGDRISCVARCTPAEELGERRACTTPPRAFCFG